MTDTSEQQAKVSAHNEAIADLQAQELLRLARIEGKLGVPHGYYQTLRDSGSDWEFAIKLVVLLEAALGTVIAAKLQHEAMRSHCDRLNLVGRTGKIDLAVGLEVLKPEEASAFAVLAEVRNRFAHKVANINSDLVSFAKELTAGELAKYYRTAMMVPKDMEVEVSFLWETPQAPEAFRYLLWTAGSMLLDALATQDVKAEAEAERRKVLEQTSIAARSQSTFKLADLFHTGPTLLTATPEELAKMRDAHESQTR
jgi:hypothetical protein